MVLHFVVRVLVYMSPGSDPKKLRIFQNIEQHNLHHSKNEMPNKSNVSVTSLESQK